MRYRYSALFIGLLYLALGALGFVPVLHEPWPPDSPALRVQNASGYLLGLFPTNLLLSAIHVAVGLWGLVGYASVGRARIFARAVAIVFGLLMILGLIPQLKTMFGLVPIFGSNIVLHALTALVGAYFGWSTPTTERDGGSVRANRRDLAKEDYRAEGTEAPVDIFGCPVHPILVSFPISFLTAVLATDLAYWWTTMPWYNVETERFYADFFSEASFWLISTGLVTGASAAVVGLIDFLVISRSRRQTTGRLYLFSSTLVFVMALVNLRLRLDSPADAILPWGIVLSSITGAVVVLAAWYGGRLVYRYRT